MLPDAWTRLLPAGSERLQKEEASDEDEDTEFFDAMEDSPAFITVTAAESSQHRSVNDGQTDTKRKRKRKKQTQGERRTERQTARHRHGERDRQTVTDENEEKDKDSS